MIAPELMRAMLDWEFQAWDVHVYMHVLEIPHGTGPPGLPVVSLQLAGLGSSRGELDCACWSYVYGSIEIPRGQHSSRKWKGRVYE